MPNVKIYLDKALFRKASAELDSLLARTRDTIVTSLGVPGSACHIVVLEVTALPGQAPVNIELCLLQKPDRSRAMVEAFCGELRDLASNVLGAPSAVRCTLAEPSTYIVVRAG